jgi:hypothetical protein
MAEPIIGLEESLQFEHLLEDLSSGQIPFHAIQAARAEYATHRASDLARNANRSARAISKQNTFDPSAIGELQKQFLGAITRPMMGCGHGAKDLEFGSQLGAESLRQIGHGLERVGSLLINPSQDLASAKLGPTVLGQPITQLRFTPIEQVLVLGIFGGCCGFNWGFNGHRFRELSRAERVPWLENREIH